MSTNSDDTFASLLLHLAAIPVLTTALWLTWNHFTDPTSPLRWSYLLLTVGIVRAAFWLVIFIAWLVRR